TTFIAYGAETSKSKLEDNSKEFTDWLSANKVNPKNYYLVVGRFVSENNFETMIREFMKSKTTKDFVLVTNVNGPFFEELQQRTGFKSDSRIKFVGTVYDQELLKKIREQAYAYFHGHEVGGTNPSLLEALSSTDLNMLLGVGFNKEVAEDSALYWTKNSGSLATLIDQNDNMPESEIARYAAASTQRVKEAYSWESVVNEYEKMF
ncbi:MAG: glycosyl transferase, partial [Fibrobacteraceae bacterium]|nr:glycosyl transferase [Fibrobacteraceae bacterium]